MKQAMWTLEQLRKTEAPMVAINDNWVSCRPVNYTKKYMSLLNRIRHAWEVFQCRAEAFTWPEGQ